MQLEDGTYAREASDKPHRLWAYEMKWQLAHDLCELAFRVFDCPPEDSHPVSWLHLLPHKGARMNRIQIPVSNKVNLLRQSGNSIPGILGQVNHNIQ